MAKLVVFRGDSVEQELHLGQQTVRIGRDAHNEIVLDDKTVTRFHAEVIPEGGAYSITDLNSRNGVWVNKQKITAKTPLTLGVPVTIGAYELTLEDDVGTSDYGEVVAANRTVVSTSIVPAEERSATSSSSTTRGRASASTATNAAAAAAKRPAVFWAGIGVGTIVLCLLTYLGVRRFTAHPAPPPAVVETPPPVVNEPPPPTTPTTPVKEDIIAGYKQAAQEAVDDKDYEAARDDIDAALELDANNPELLEAKNKIAQLMTAPPPPPPKKEPVKPVEAPVVEVSGIPRRPNEPPPDYTARAQRVQANLRNGLAALDQEEFARAITLFQAVDRDQKGYMNIDGLLSDAATKQKRQVDIAINSGQENERANNLVNAIKWYERALRFDPNSTAAQERLAGIADKRNKQGQAAFDRAEVLRKRNDPKAVASYQEAVDLLPSNNPKKAEAQQWLDKLK